MNIPFSSAFFVLLCLGLLTEVVLFALRRFRSGWRAEGVARFLAWFFRPVMAAAVANTLFRMSGSVLSNRRTYPFYANVWTPDGVSFADHVRNVFSREGILPWLPVAVLSALALVSVAVFAARSKKSRWRFRRIPPLFAVLFGLSFSLFVSLASVPNGLFTGEGQKSSLLAPWHDSGSTMLYAVPHMRPTAKSYLRNFPDIQKGLGHTIHAKSHPPVASLFVRWIGQAVGVDVHDPLSYRDARVRLRYALGQTAVSAANLFLVFCIGAAMFDRRTGLFAAVLWCLAPSVCHYATFAPDMNYALFFHGAVLFTWLVATAENWRRSLSFALPLGLCFAMLVFMNFSWCIATTVFAVFVLAVNLRERRGWRDLVLRGVPALAVMTLAAGWALRHYHVDYLAIYRTSSEFVSRFYRHGSRAEAALCVFGCQAEWLVLLGPVVCSGFFLFLRETRRAGTFSVQRLFVWTLLAVFAVPIVFGPGGLKHETARCWIWMAAVPIACSASRWLGRSSPRLCGAVALSSAATTIGLRLLVYFEA